MDANQRTTNQDSLKPELRVVVDTTKPQIECTAQAVEGGDVLVRWQAIDPKIGELTSGFEPTHLELQAIEEGMDVIGTKNGHHIQHSPVVGGEKQHRQRRDELGHAVAERTALARSGPCAISLAIIGS